METVPSSKRFLDRSSNRFSTVSRPPAGGKPWIGALAVASLIALFGAVGSASARPLAESSDEVSVAASAAGISLHGEVVRKRYDCEQLPGIPAYTLETSLFKGGRGAVNSSGVVVYSTGGDNSASSPHVLVYRSTTGEFLSIQEPNGTSQSIAESLSDSGTIGGVLVNFTTHEIVPFLAPVSANGASYTAAPISPLRRNFFPFSPFDVGVSLEGINSTAYTISGGGSGALRLLPALPETAHDPCSGEVALGVNAAGTIVGFDSRRFMGVWWGIDTYPLRWDNGQISKISNQPGLAIGVDDEGTIVGSSFGGPLNQLDQGWVKASSDPSPVELTQVIRSGLPPGYVLGRPVSISARNGYILVAGYPSASFPPSSNNDYRFFLLKPI